MARPIEPTPVLRGKEAEAFIKAAQNPQPYVKPVLDMAKLRDKAQQIIAAREKK